MADPETNVAATEAPKAQEYTALQASAELNDWLKRVRAAGLNPVQLVAAAGIREGKGFFNDILSALESGVVNAGKK